MKEMLRSNSGFFLAEIVSGIVRLNVRNYQRILIEFVCGFCDFHREPRLKFRPHLSVGIDIGVVWLQSVQATPVDVVTDICGARQSRRLSNVGRLLRDFLSCSIKSHVQMRRVSLLLTAHTHAHTHTPVLTAFCPGLPGSASTRKVKPIWILLKQETVSGSGISWD